MASRNSTGRSCFDSAIWSVCDILRRSNCAGAMQYVPELTWVLFLRILDETEQREGEMAKPVGADFRHSLAFDLKAINPNAKTDEDTRRSSELLEFISAKNEELRDPIIQLKASA